MNTRERFVRCLTGQEVDRVPFIKLFGGENAIQPAWENEYPGISKCIDELLGFEGKGRGWESTPVNYMLSNLPPEVILENTDKRLIRRRGDGGIELLNKNEDFFYHVLEYPVKCKEDWYEIKEKYLDPDDPARFPSDWSRYVDQYKNREYPLQLNHGGVYGFARYLMGDEKLLITFYDDPEMIHDIMRTYSDMCFRLWEKMLDKVDFDLIECWEDMAYSKGCLISPDMFREFMKPIYQKISTFAEAHNIKIILVDSDGFIENLTGLMSESGVNAMYPYEVQSGNNVGKILGEYPYFACLGGLDKRVMSRSKKDIDLEIEKAREFLTYKRFIPGPDHVVLKDVKFENYRYFMNRLRDLIING